MNVDFTNEELLFVYGRLKRELSDLESSKVVRVSKSDIKLYKSILAKLEKSNPSLAKLPL